MFNDLLALKKFEPKLVAEQWCNPPLNKKLSRSPDSFSTMLKQSDSIQHVAHAFEIPVGQLIYILKNKERFYNEFEIPKKSGGSRKISSPKKGVEIRKRAVNHT